jgi:hypothetical protein
MQRGSSDPDGVLESGERRYVDDGSSAGELSRTLKLIELQVANKNDERRARWRRILAAEVERATRARNEAERCREAMEDMIVMMGRHVARREDETSDALNDGNDDRPCPPSLPLPPDVVDDDIENDDTENGDIENDDDMVRRDESSTTTDMVSSEKQDLSTQQLVPTASDESAHQLVASHDGTPRRVQPTHVSVYLPEDWDGRSIDISVSEDEWVDDDDVDTPPTRRQIAVVASHKDG